ncbi:MAG: Maleylpyruvate isomerase, mycothiol-dependent [uncultured Nocardioides sp.]|uniref:Maleylpyruvate isomerase, mycothiol-dependent n=1 Tax=uncultured Nocardioides sp. TaxID=198441 RepID=A0A6J4MQK1_9ACTN|nr:MAG: Maleylpyruvate isomerase, mycothiol-dependent [uncultured Nocardioides sp.]
MTPAPVLSPTLLPEADQRLVRTVDGLTGEELSAPSLLPGWTRAHVVAHLTLNGEALQRVLQGRRRGEAVPMYDSPEARDRDIDHLALADPAVLRERLLAAVTRFGVAQEAMTEEDAAATFERTPGGRVIRIGNVALMRLREVEIHHADLDAGYSALDWPAAFCAVLIESMTKYQDSAPFRVLARDLARTWQLGDGEGGPLVAGDAAAIGWWLTGRGHGEGLDCDAGELPEVSAW